LCESVVDVGPPEGGGGFLVRKTPAKKRKSYGGGRSKSVGVGWGGGEGGGSGESHEKLC